MSIATESMENAQHRENSDMKISEKCKKRAGAEKETSYGKPKRYLIGFGMLTKTRKLVYAIHYK